MGEEGDHAMIIVIVDEDKTDEEKVYIRATTDKATGAMDLDMGKPVKCAEKKLATKKQTPQLTAVERLLTRVRVQNCADDMV